MTNESDRNDDTRWVEDQLATLDPPSAWQPNSHRALERLTERPESRRQFRWAPVSMAVAVVAAVGLVLILLPWQVLLKTTAQARPAEAVPQEQPEIVQATPTETVPVQETTPPVSAEPATPNPQPVRTVPVTAAPPPVEENQEAKPAPAQTGVTEPKVVYRVQPAYTDEARQARAQGTVRILCLVNVDGTVEIREITQSLGYGLDESAAAALMQWRFEPGTKDGKAVPVFTSVLFNFGLK